MLNKSRSHYKSSPSLVSSSKTFSRGRDELEERFLDLRDQHLGLRLEANQAQQEVRILHAKLSRLIAEKKRYFRHEKTERETALEEQIHDLEQQQQRLIKQNDVLRDRIQLIRVQNSNKDTIRHRSASSHYGRSTVGHHSSGASMHHRQQTLSSTYTVSASSGGASAYINHQQHHHHQSGRISSAYANVQSKTDSGLGVYFRPLSIQSNGVVRSKSHTDLRPTSSSYASTSIPVLASNHPSQSKLPLTATMLMHEAKEEIIRLESIVAQQQNLLDTLLSENATDDSAEQANEVNGQLPHNNDNNDVRFQEPTGRRGSGVEQQLTTSNQISYTITTTTSHRTVQPPVTNSIVRTNGGSGSKGSKQQQQPPSQHYPQSSNRQSHFLGTTNGVSNGASQIKSLPNGDQSTSESTQSVDLWNKYQQILLHKESAQRISGDIHLLIERLYRALQEEKQKVVQLKAKLSGRPEYSSVIADRDKQIEILRKENFLLQESLNQFVNQCMSLEEMKAGGSTNAQRATSAKHQQMIKTIFAERQKVFEQQIEQLNSKLSSTDYLVQEERLRYDSLRNKYDNLEKLAESDQLKIRHLEAKIGRLSAIVFNNPENHLTTQSVPVTPVNLRSSAFSVPNNSTAQEETEKGSHNKKMPKKVSTNSQNRSPTFKSLPFILNDPPAPSLVNNKHSENDNSPEESSVQSSSLDDYRPDHDDLEAETRQDSTKIHQQGEEEEEEEEAETGAEQSNDFVLSSFTGHEISELDNLLNSLPNLDHELK